MDLEDFKKTAPEEIYLNVGFGEVASDFVDFEELEGVTWSEDRTRPSDLNYVRADLFESLKSQLSEVKTHAERLERHYEELVQALGEGKPGQKHEEIMGKIEDGEES